MSADRTREPFGDVLRSLRERAGLSGHALARRVGIDPSYLNRLERGQRDVPRESMVAVLVDTLALDAAAADRLFLAAGYLPPSLAALGTADSTLLELARVLTAPEVPAAARDDLRQALALILRHWRTLRVRSERGPGEGAERGSQSHGRIQPAPEREMAPVRV